MVGAGRSNAIGPALHWIAVKSIKRHARLIDQDLAGRVGRIHKCDTVRHLVTLARLEQRNMPGAILAVTAAVPRLGVFGIGIERLALQSPLLRPVVARHNAPVAESGCRRRGSQRRPSLRTITDTARFPGFILVVGIERHALPVSIGAGGSGDLDTSCCQQDRSAGAGRLVADSRRRRQRRRFGEGEDSALLRLFAAEAKDAEGDGRDTNHADDQTRN